MILCLCESRLRENERKRGEKMGGDEIFDLMESGSRDKMEVGRQGPCYRERERELTSHG